VGDIEDQRHIAADHLEAPRHLDDGQPLANVGLESGNREASSSVTINTAAALLSWKLPRSAGIGRASRWR